MKLIVSMCDKVVNILLLVILSIFSILPDVETSQVYLKTLKIMKEYFRIYLLNSP